MSNDSNYGTNTRWYHGTSSSTLVLDEQYYTTPAHTTEYTTLATPAGYPSTLGGTRVLDESQSYVEGSR